MTEPADRPYLSVVVASRNDGYAGGALCQLASRRLECREAVLNLWRDFVLYKSDVPRVTTSRFLPVPADPTSRGRH